MPFVCVQIFAWSPTVIRSTSASGQSAAASIASTIPHSLEQNIIIYCNIVLVLDTDGRPTEYNDVTRRRDELLVGLRWWRSVWFVSVWTRILSTRCPPSVLFKSSNRVTRIGVKLLGSNPCANDTMKYVWHCGHCVKRNL